jgi:hypothetical protein
VPGYEASTWYGIGAPKNTPAEAVEKQDKARLADLGCIPLPGSPDDFGKLIANETAKWAKVVKFSGAKPD